MTERTPDTPWRALAVLAARAPDAAWLSDGRHTWRAEAVLREVELLAARLHRCRVLAVLADNSPAWVIADLAAQQAGAVHLPLPAFFGAAQLTHALTLTGADTVLTDQPERIGALELGFAITGSWQGLTQMRRVVAEVAMPRGTGKVSFTSGSTGAPKGVCLTAAGLLDTAQAVDERLADLAITRHLATLPLALLLENVAGVYAPLLRGACVHLPPLEQLGWRGMAGFDAPALHDAVWRHRPDSLILVPELLKSWTAWLRQSERPVPANLRFVAVGGARVADALLSRARAGGIPAYQGYGLTECGSVVCLNRPADDGDGVGRPLAHVRLEIAQQEVRIAAPVFAGYLGDPGDSDQPGEPRESGESGDTPPPHPMFHTGDLGAFDARGHLHLHGRRKHLLINSFGRNIAPEWVESVLLAQFAIAQAVVAGDARPALGAILVAAPGAGENEVARAVADANAGLPDYARVTHWRLVPPFTPANGQATGNGRPLRAAILAAHADALAALHADSSSTQESVHALL